MLKLFNSLTRKVEEFVPISKGIVGVYTCGPTVYDRKHIGNFRTYLTSDLLIRVLRADGFQVKHVMNFTDVGHLTGDNEGDADTGEDRLVKAANRERKTAWEIAEEYAVLFLSDFENLGFIKPFKFALATDHISDQINLIKKLEKRGFVYRTSDGIYFDTIAFEKKTNKKYGELSTLDEIREGVRRAPNKEKHNPRDFALWKFSPRREKRDMEWESPWGVGFPGWHIECSAMSMKYLGESFDIHLGGEDLRSTHHPNEIAQSEGATDMTFVKYWVHTAFILIDGNRMSTSLGNNYNLTDIGEKGFSPSALKYLFLSSNYRDQLNFTWNALGGAQTALNRLQDQLVLLKENKERAALSVEKEEKIEKFRDRFIDALNNDLNSSQAIAIIWETIKSNIPARDKYDLLLYFNEVLGLGINIIPNSIGDENIPLEVRNLLEERENARRSGNFQQADDVRIKINKLGYGVKDTPEGSKLRKNTKTS